MQPVLAKATTSILIITEKLHMLATSGPFSECTARVTNLQTIQFAKCFPKRNGLEPALSFQKSRIVH